MQSRRFQRAGRLFTAFAVVLMGYALFSPSAQAVPSMTRQTEYQGLDRGVELSAYTKRQVGGALYPLSEIQWGQYRLHPGP